MSFAPTARLFWIALAAATAVYAAWPAWRRAPVDGSGTRVLLDAEALLRSDGTEFAFSVRRPSRIRIRVLLPEGLEGTVRVGPAAPAGPRDLAYAPRPDDEVRFTVEGRSSEPTEIRVLSVGPQFIRIEPIPTAMGAEALEVRAIVHAAPID